MILSIIVAMDENRGIGYKNRLPWRLSADLVRFKAITMNHHVIMGRKTYESIGRVLPGRTMIVISHNESYYAEGCLVAHSLEGAINFAKKEGEDEAFVIGGATIYEIALPKTDRLYLTQVHAVTEADVFFPEWDEEDWVEVRRIEQPVDEKNQYSSTFRILNRKL